MKTTRCREATDGEWTAQYCVSEAGGPVDVVGCQWKGRECDFWKLMPADRKAIIEICEEHADRHESEMRGGEEP